MRNSTEMTAHSQVLGHSACILNLCAEFQQEDVLNSDKSEVVQKFYMYFILFLVYRVTKHKFCGEKKHILQAAETVFYSQSQ